MFNSAGTSFLGGEACAYDRTSLLTGAAATQQFSSLGANYGVLLTSAFDGTRQPPAGSPNYLVADGAVSNQLAYWAFHTDWANSANTTLTGPTTLATAAFTSPCGGNVNACVPQSGTSQRLDTLGDRLMYRLAYRNFGDHEALVVNRSIAAGSSVGLPWSELRRGGGNSLGIVQQGTYAPDANYRWMGSIAQDSSGNIGLGYSVSSSSMHPQIRYTGRLVGDPAGTMTQGEGTIIAGAGSQNGNLSRWGDYSTIAVDPADDCTFWYANEYIPSNGSFTGWTTSGATSVSTTPHTGSFSAQVGSTSPFNGDSTIAQTFTAPTPTGPLTFWYQVHCPDTVTYDWATASLTDNTAGTTATLLSRTCSNSGAWVQSSPASLTGGHSYTLNLLNHDDNYPGDPTYTFFDDVALAAPPAPDFAIAVSPSSQSVVQGTGTSYTVTVTAQNGFVDTVSLSASGFGSGASPTFSPTSVTGSGTSTLSVTTTSDAATGSSPITITGTSGTLNHSIGATLVVTGPPDFAISATPSSRTVTVGNSTTYTVTVTATNGFGSAVTLGAIGFGAGASGSFSPASIAGGGSSTLTATTGSTATTGTYTITITGSSGSLSHTASVTLLVNPAPASVIVNGGLETGDLTGWATSGATSVSSTAHTGTHSAQVGSSSPSSRATSISQTFPAPTGTGHTLSFWYRVVCTDTVTYDWATVTLKDNTTNTTTTVLARTCTNNGSWVQRSVTLTGGHSYTLTLIDHDDNWINPPDPTYTLYDDFSVN